jgi:hypothetical protein
MNPICLLTKGRTFKDMADRPGAYKLLARSALSNFAAGKRPTPRYSHSVPKTSQTTLFEQPKAAVKAAVVEAGKSATPPVVPANPPQSVISPFAPIAKKPETPYVRDTYNRTTRYCKWWVKRYIFGHKGRLVDGPTVQAELALEKVTVMKNDLNEDDLEVVLVERKVGTGEKPLARLSKMEMTGEAWLRLTAPFRKKGNESAISPKAGTKLSPELSARV